MRVLLTGATGFVGGHIVEALLERGHHCVALGRRPLKARPNLTSIQADLLNWDSLGEALKGCDAVIHLVGIIRENPRRGATFEGVHIKATANLLLKACKEQGASRFIHMSAFGASPHSRARYHRTKHAAEELVKASGLEYAIFRPSLILGKGSQFVKDMRRMLSFPVVGVLGGDYRLQPVAVGDVVAAFVEALEGGGLLGGTWELCGPRVFTLKELLQLMAEVWGKRPLFLTLPPAPMKAAAALLDRFGWFPVTKEQIIMLEEGNVCGHGRAFEILNRAPIPIEDILKLC